uniref:Uncharacterized protein n=1 Tax=Anguilla anguilla TaxID=7936 RepID=A0A0E9QF88_ANGAN
MSVFFLNGVLCILINKVGIIKENIVWSEQLSDSHVVQSNNQFN